MLKLFTAMLLAAATVQAHYTFPRMIINGQTETSDWGYTRKTKNYQSNGPIESVSSPDIRCNQLNTAGKTAVVAAGSSIAFTTSQQLNHPGPVQFYMAKVPSGASVDSWDGSGQVWFRVHTESPTVSNGQLVWPGNNEYKSTTFTIPTSLPSGYYLLRVEHIALHQAQNAGGAQFYQACAQLQVTGGGNGTPGPLVSFPGAYSATDPGIMLNIYYPVPTNYKSPGPAVWRG